MMDELVWGCFTLDNCPECGKEVFLREYDFLLYEPDPVEDCLRPHVCEGK